MLIRSFDDLSIYMIASELSSDVEKLVKLIPRHWQIPEVGQILRSSSSVQANIAEGFSQRFYPKKFILYLNIALGSSDETKNHWVKLIDDRHLHRAKSEEITKKYKNLSVRILNFINYLRKKHNID